nr:hypothetical protein [Tanacetum cinerariifolium]
MTTPFPATTPRAKVVSFIIISDYEDEITTLPVRPVPPSPDYVPTLPNSDLYPDLSEDASPSKDSMKITESLHTQISSTSVVHPPPLLFPSSSSLPSSLMSSSSSLPSSLMPSSSSPPSSLLPSSTSSPPSSLLPSSFSPLTCRCE